MHCCALHGPSSNIDRGNFSYKPFVVSVPWACLQGYVRYINPQIIINLYTLLSLQGNCPQSHICVCLKRCQSLKYMNSLILLITCLTRNRISSFLHFILCFILMPKINVNTNVKQNKINIYFYIKSANCNQLTIPTIWLYHSFCFSYLDWVWFSYKICFNSIQCRNTKYTYYIHNQNPIIFFKMKHEHSSCSMCDCVQSVSSLVSRLWSLYQ